MSRDVAAGNKLRGERIELEWSADQAASIYGQAVKGTPITRKAYLRMEEGYLPKDPRRRWILARMLGIAPVVLGLSTPESAKYISYSPSKRAKPVDMSEYRAALLSYWKHGSSGSVQGALKDITRRIYALHDTIPYVSPNQKDPLKRLLCGYQMRGAEFVRELGYDAKALDHLNKAVILAHEEEFLDLEAAALYRRGEFYFDKWMLKAALRDFQSAQKLDVPASNAQPPKYPLPPQVKGRILNVRGLTQARLAQKDEDMTVALRFIDSSEILAGQNAEENDGLVDLTKELYFRNRAKALVGPPIKDYHFPDKALEALDEMHKNSLPELKRFYIYEQMDGSIIEAQIYLDKEYYPIAAERALNAVSIMQETKSNIHLPAITRIYEKLKTSPYKKSTEVAEIGVNLLFLEYPHFFQFPSK